MPQAVTTADVHQGCFRCGCCEAKLTIFYHTHCLICDQEFTLLEYLSEEEESDGRASAGFQPADGNGSATALQDPRPSAKTQILKPPSKSNVLLP